ncbi:hypothetical protein ACFFKC_04180 [Pseudoduganella danionis]|uniref:Uncharacterized protein n=1 Tax=Pseudoduganella danionis TaxID=1890295 RepID=A0ABW9SLH4_9BURK|nr:hypothetical protein [Pseudoduganella danionis]MTW31289.1 hypothetical protein [Pseudoduganella danionis]
MHDTKINTRAKRRNDGVQRLPHERDESPESELTPNRSVIRQAASDVEEGLVDTDRHNQPGAETTRATGGKPPSGQARPQPGTKRD